jgi:type I restriction enzyme, S subunit
MTLVRPLSDVTTLISRGISPKYTDERKTVVLNQKCIRDGQVNLSLGRFHDHEIKGVPGSKIICRNDILVNSTGVGTLGRVSQVVYTDIEMTVDSHVTIVRPDISVIDPDYLGAFMFLNQASIEALGHGSTGQTELSRHNLGELEVQLPSLKHQKFIGQLFQNFHKKIELNQKMNQTLEEIAKAIFKSWFVDFDPVRAKAEGRPTGLPPEISDIFPDELVDSEIGEIPKGWAVSTFADVLQIQGGYAFKSKDFGDEGHPVIKIKNIRGDGTVNQFDCDRVANVDKKLDRFLLRDGDAVIAMTGATVGKVGLMSVVDEKFYLNQRVGRLISKSSSDSCWYSVLLLNSGKTKGFIEGYAYGSAQPNISSKDIESIPNVTPGSEIVEVFNKVASPLFLKTLLILKENDLLSELRDTLLPKLISGELRIPDAEKFLEEAGI